MHFDRDFLFLAGSFDTLLLNRYFREKVIVVRVSVGAILEREIRVINRPLLGPLCCHPMLVGMVVFTQAATRIVPRMIRVVALDSHIVRLFIRRLLIGYLYSLRMDMVVADLFPKSNEFIERVFILVNPCDLSLHIFFDNVTFDPLNQVISIVASQSSTLPKVLQVLNLSQPISKSQDPHLLPILPNGFLPILHVLHPMPIPHLLKLPLQPHLILTHGLLFLRNLLNLLEVIVICLRRLL